MARSLNKVMLIGNVADEPTVRPFNNSTGGIGKVASLTLVTNEYRSGEEGQPPQEFPEWHRITIWNRLAEVVDSYVHKGNKLYIEGKIRTRSYVDKEGIKRYATEIIADQLIMLSPNPNANNGQYQSFGNNRINQPAAANAYASQQVSANYGGSYQHNFAQNQGMDYNNYQNHSPVQYAQASAPSPMPPFASSPVQASAPSSMPSSAPGPVQASAPASMGGYDPMSQVAAQMPSAQQPMMQASVQPMPQAQSEPAYTPFNNFTGADTSGFDKAGGVTSAVGSDDSEDDIPF